MPDYVSKFTGQEIDAAIQKATDIAKSASDINTNLVYTDALKTNLSTVSENELLSKKSDGSLQGTGILNEDDKIFFPKDGRFPSASIDIGPATTISENGGWLQYHSNTLDKEYILLDYEIDNTGTQKPIYWERDAEQIGQIINSSDSITMNNFISFNHTPTANSQVNALYLNFATSITNLCIECKSLNTGKVIKYIPNEKAWKTNTGGLNLASGSQNVLQGTTPLSLLTSYNLQFNFKADSQISLKGDGTKPYLAVDRQLITAKPIALEEELNGGSGSDTAQAIRDKLESLTGDERLRAVAVRNLPEETADTVRDKLAGLSGDNRLDASAIKNLPGGSGGSETGETIKTKLEALTGDNRLSANALKDLPSGTAETAESIRDKLETLTGDNKLAATALKNISDVINRIDGGSANAVFTDTMNGGAA